MSLSRARKIDNELPAFLRIDTTAGAGDLSPRVDATSLVTSLPISTTPLQSSSSATVHRQPATPAPSDLSGQQSAPRRLGDPLRHLAAVPRLTPAQQDRAQQKTPVRVARGNSKVFPRPRGQQPARTWNKLVPRHAKPAPGTSPCCPGQQGADNGQATSCATNKLTASPFKQHRKKEPTPPQHEQLVAPDSELKHSTLNATYLMAKVFGHHNDPDVVQPKGKLKKARLKEMEPVSKMEPEISHCCGIIPGGNQQIVKYEGDNNDKDHEDASRYRSRTLERRRKVLSMMSRDFLYDPQHERRPNTAAGQSIHCTSVASDLSELNSPDMSPRLDYEEYMRSVVKKERPASVPQKEVRFFGQSDPRADDEGQQESMRSKSATAGSSAFNAHDKTSCKQQAGSTYFRDDDDEDDFYEDFTRKNTNLNHRFNNKLSSETQRKSEERKEKDKQVEEANEALQYEKEIKRKNWQMGIHSGETTSVEKLKSNRLYQNMQRRVRIMSGKQRPSTVPAPPSCKPPSVTTSRARAKSAVEAPKSIEATSPSRIHLPFSRAKSAGHHQGHSTTFLTQEADDVDARSVDSDYCSWKDYEIEGIREDMRRDWALESPSPPGGRGYSHAHYVPGEGEEDDEDERFRVRFEELQRAVQCQVDVFAGSNAMQYCS